MPFRNMDLLVPVFLAKTDLYSLKLISEMYFYKICL